MTPARRLVAVLGLALVVVAAVGIPASASFSDNAALPTMSAGTATVAAPGNVTGRLTCASRNSTMEVSWTASTARNITGYRVTTHFSDGFDQSETVAATATSWSKSISTLNVTQYSVRWSVTTLTAYGWTTRSVLTGSAQC